MMPRTGRVELITKLSVLQGSVASARTSASVRLEQGAVDEAGGEANKGVATPLSYGVGVALKGPVQGPAEDADVDIFVYRSMWRERD